MTYARKLAVGYAFKNSFEGVDSEVTEVEVIINKAMQAQKQADAEAAKIVVLSHSSIVLVKKVQEAILNAEVKE